MLLYCDSNIYYIINIFYNIYNYFYDSYIYIKIYIKVYILLQRYKCKNTNYNYIYFKNK